MSGLHSALSGDRRGLAAVEFALIAPMLLMILGGVTDFGLIMVGRSQLANGVAQGAQSALQTGVAVTAAAITTKVQNGASWAGLTQPVTVTVTGPACYCVTASPVTLASKSALSGSNTCTGTCAAPQTGPSAFVTITAQYTYQPLMPLYSQLSSPTVTQTVTLRLQ